MSPERLTQLVESLLSMHMTLGSIPIIWAGCDAARPLSQHAGESQGKRIRDSRSSSITRFEANLGFMRSILKEKEMGRGVFLCQKQNKRNNTKVRLPHFKSFKVAHCLGTNCTPQRGQLLSTLESSCIRFHHPALLKDTVPVMPPVH